MLEANINSFSGVEGTLVPASFAAISTSELLSQAKNQNELAFSELMKRHQSFIDCKVQKFAPDWNSRIELTDKVNEQVRLLISEVSAVSDLKVWLEKLIQRVFFDELKRKDAMDRADGNSLTGTELVRARTRTSMCSIEPDYAGEDSKLCDEVFRKKALVVSMISKLEDVPEKLKKAQFLHDIEGLSYEEISELTHIDTETLQQNICSAREKIREGLAPFLRNAAE